MQNAKKTIKGYNCDEVMENVSFWEELRDVLEEIEIMSQKELEKCLFDIVQKEMSEGMTWQRQTLKVSLTNPERRKHILEAIKSGKVYEQEESDIEAYVSTENADGELYLFEECSGCGFIYVHRVKRESEESIITAYKNKTLTDSQRAVMRGIDCPRCKSNKTRLFDLQRIWKLKDKNKQGGR